MSEWVEENAPGVNYHTFRRRFLQWQDADCPHPPSAIPIINRSLSQAPCHIPGLGDARGGHNRKWTREQEQQCAELILKPAIREGTGLSDPFFIVSG